jgi:hypothetical protein
MVHGRKSRDPLLSFARIFGLLIGVRTVPVPHGLDGSRTTGPYPCRSDLVPTSWTDGGRDGLDPSKAVNVRSSQP